MVDAGWKKGFPTHARLEIRCQRAYGL